MLSIENAFLKAEIAEAGAELKSLINLSTGKELMWSGDPDFWNKTSPVLFPVVGALKDDMYFFKNKEYRLSRHGFAREAKFSVEKQDDNSVVMLLRSNVETRKKYPFDFELYITYTLVESTLTCSYLVKNTNDESMLFSLGAHPAFAVTVNENERFSDFSLLFNKDEVLKVNTIVNNLISDNVFEIDLSKRTLRLTYDLFYNDALVMKNLQSDSIKLTKDGGRTGLEFNFKDFPFFGIWTVVGSNFICLEPWCGIADLVDHNQQLEDKEGIVTLPSYGSFARSWSVSLLN